MGLLRVLCNLDVQENSVRWSREISEWFSMKTAESRQMIKMLDEIDGVNANTKARDHNAEILNALVSYRNKQFAHSANLRRERLERQVVLLERVLVYLLDSASFLKEMDMIHVERVEVAEGDRWCIRGVQLSGISDAPVDALTNQKPNLDDVYVGCIRDGELQEPPIAVGPFIIRKHNRETRVPELFVYNDAWRTKLEYISFQSGSHYYHKELQRDFEDLVDLQLESSRGIEEHPDLSSEERSEYASQLLKKARVHSEEGRYEYAISLLEESIEYTRTPEAFSEIAELQYKLGDPEESVLQTLQCAFDINPDHTKSIQVYKKVKEHSSNKNNNVKNKTCHAKTIYHAITPNKYKNFSRFFVTLTILLWYFTSMYLDFSLNSFVNYTNIFQFIFSSSLVLSSYQRIMMKNVKYPLSIQLDKMRLSRFEEWFDQKMIEVWGSFVIENKKLNVAKSFKEESKFWTYGAGFVTSCTLLSVLVIPERNISGASYLYVTVDWVILYSILWYAIYVANSFTTFILSISNISLKPSLMRVGREGIYSMSNLITLVVFQITFSTVFFLLCMKSYAKSQVIADTLVVGTSTVFFFFWSIRMPLLVRRAMVKAKQNVANKYYSLLEKSFQDYIKNPDKDTLKRYNWLLEKKYTLDNIKVWPMSFFQTLIIIFCNFFLFFFAVYYVRGTLYIESLLSIIGIHP